MATPKQRKDFNESNIDFVKLDVLSKTNTNDPFVIVHYKDLSFRLTNTNMELIVSFIRRLTHA